MHMFATRSAGSRAGGGCRMSALRKEGKTYLIGLNLNGQSNE